MFPWSDAPTPEPAYAVGETVYSGSSIGTVVSVDAKHGIVSVEWKDVAYGPIKYPIDAECLRKKMPWET